jgi:hypothetical protein
VDWTAESGRKEIIMRRSKVHAGRRAGVVLLLVTLILGVAGGVAAAKGGSSIDVKKPWARTSPMEATNGAVYMVLTNESKSDEALVGASVPASVAMVTEIHETVMGSDGSMGSTGTTMAGGMGSTGTTMAGGMGSGGTMTMREVEQIVIPAESTVKLEPGGYHIMLVDLVEPLETGSKIKVTLEFESGKTQTVKAIVKK